MRSILFVVLLFPFSAYSLVVNQEGCAYFADAALVARTLSKNNVKRPLANKIMADIYIIPNLQAQAVISKIADMAYGSDKAPHEMAGAILKACYAASGDTDKFIGTGV